MSRRIAHFSCGAASAVATKLSTPDEIWYAATGSEDADNARFMRDCEKWFGQPIRVIRSEKYSDTWAVWEDRKYLAGIRGAPCTGELKVGPRLAAQLPDDIHVFGYTADANDARRAQSMREHWPARRVPADRAGTNKSGVPGDDRDCWYYPTPRLLARIPQCELHTVRESHKPRLLGRCAETSSRRVRAHGGFGESDRREARAV